MAYVIQERGRWWWRAWSWSWREMIETELCKFMSSGGEIKALETAAITEEHTKDLYIEDKIFTI